MHCISVGTVSGMPEVSQRHLPLINMLLRMNVLVLSASEHSEKKKVKMLHLKG